MRVKVQTTPTALLAAGVFCGLIAGVAAQAPTVKQMHESLALVNDVEYSVVRGDYQGAADPARALSMQTNPRDLPAKGHPFMDEVRTLAVRTASASDIQNAAQSVAGLVSACGKCHAALGTPVRIAPPARPAMSGARGEMLQHNWAVSLLAVGLQGPTDAVWKQGADELATAKVAPADAAQDVKDAETELRAIAKRAIAAGDEASRTVVYGELIAACGTCHGLLGRVLGPGVPGAPK